ncbi:Methanogenic corrinoid protein MtbC1 [Hymenobacter daecheongensis DSM 21074]|uniref:Methanogenic corrinoid protein MtbC1 n=1 Tax=Hymenobacter daecheongensis DSM 21074 TaxID=1121955 RepID=A0A1M6ENW1_9BACT|nr:cobalamin-dependent protein [Hymenobacter daecheongensis]SHI87151.1 Methanogenic corrinoid protein MtbC1 [Hymenobacter daecheongensis DSM 21074]
MKEKLEQQRTAQALYGQANDLTASAVSHYHRLVVSATLVDGSVEESQLRAELKSHLLVLADTILMQSAALFEVHLTHVRQQQPSPARDQELASQLDALKQVLSQRLPIMEYIQVAGYLNGALAQLQQPIAEADAPAEAAAPDAPLARLMASYLSLLLAGKSAQAIELVVEKARRGTDVGDLYEQVLLPAQSEVGQRWHRGELNVAQEHYCTAAAEQAIASLRQYRKPAPATGHRFLATTLAGDLHVLPVRVVAELLEADGWTPFYLGGNMPLASVWQAAVDYQVDLLVLGASMSHHVGSVRDLLAARPYVQAATQVRVLVGGPPFNADPDLWRVVGADACAPNARAAVEAARQLVGQP